MGSTLFCDISVLQADGTIALHRYVGVNANGVFDYLADTPPPHAYDETIDGKNHLLQPGFYNPHSHLPMTLLRGYGENLPLQQWLEQRIFPFEAQMTAQDVHDATLLAFAELFACGVVSCSDMYYHGEAMVQAALSAGAKCNLSMSTLCFDETPYDALPIAREADALFADYHGAGDGRIQIDLCLHGEYTSNERIARGLADHAQRLGARVQLHLSETKLEHEGCLARHGITPAAYALRCGLFSVPATAAHCVWCTEDDVEILARHGVHVATCPASNLKLASGFAPIDALLRHGVNVGLATDGVASNNDHDLFIDRRLFMYSQRAFRNDPTFLSPQEAFQMSSRAGAKSQGREDCGEIALGFRADVAMLCLDAPHFQPVDEIVQHLLFSATGHDVVLTMIDGRIVYRNGVWPTIDLAAVTARVNAAKSRILASL